MARKRKTLPKDFDEILQSGDPAVLMELAVQWVSLNPMPIALAKPDYDR